VQQRRHRETKAQSAAVAIPATAGLGFYLREAYRAFSKQFHARLARHGITHAQFVLLWFLSQAGSLTPLALSREAGIKKASATGVIEQLKRRKLIRGDRDRDDGRKVNLALTPAGATLMRELMACAAETNADGQRSLTEEESKTLLRLLRAVTTSFETSDGGT